LTSDETHVWLARPDSITDPELLDRYRQLLTPEERARGERFRFRRHGDQFLITRALVRTRLSHYFDVSPESWRFRADENGRPEIETPTPTGVRGAGAISFNLSHTDGLIACAIHFGARIGCDVENLGRRIEGDGIAKRFFAASERDELGATPQAQRRERFLELWTLKEAYLKACGTGLRTPLGAFAFELPPVSTSRRGCCSPEVRIRFDELDDSPGDWRFSLLRPGPTHVLAVALHSKAAPTLRIRDCVPLCDGEASGERANSAE